MADLPFGFSPGDDPDRDGSKKDRESSPGDPFGSAGGAFNMADLGQIFTQLGQMFSGAGNAAAGIWCWYAKDVTIQYCESHHNHTAGTSDVWRMQLGLRYLFN